MKDKDIKEHVGARDHKKIVELIYQLELQGYDVKVNLYKNGRKEIRILAK